MGIANSHNIGAETRAYPIFNGTQGLQKSSDDTTEISGRVIDRLALGRHYLSCKVIVPFGANTPTSQGVRIIGRMLHSGTSTTANIAFGSTGITRLFATTTTATATAISGVAEFDYDLRTAGRYLQFGVAASLVTSSSGALNYNAAAVFGGADERPALPLQTTPINNG